jgi:hypothetical protein
MGDRAKDARSRALGQELRAMFRNVEQRPIPVELRAIVDQLDAAPEPPRKGGAKKP